MLPNLLQEHLFSIPGLDFEQCTPISGGDINRAGLLSARDGRKWFIKYNNAPSAEAMFHAEALGLQSIGAPGCIAVPGVIAKGCSPGGCAYLILDYITPGHRHLRFWESFGRALACQHQTSSASFGFDHDNFIGSLPQSNTYRSSWGDFYTLERLQPQMHMALDNGLMSASDARRMDDLCAHLDDICPQEPPALIHGDLWSGNFLCNAEGHPVLIDPASCYAHREMDLAMSRLFGGFDAAFYRSYEEAWPLSPGFEARMEVYQLYYLLVHVNLFGGGYVGAVREVLRHWGRLPV